MVCLINFRNIVRKQKLTLNIILDILTYFYLHIVFNELQHQKELPNVSEHFEIICYFLTMLMALVYGRSYVNCDSIFAGRVIYAIHFTKIL